MFVGENINEVEVCRSVQPKNAENTAADLLAKGPTAECVGEEYIEMHRCHSRCHRATRRSRREELYALSTIAVPVVPEGAVFSTGKQQECKTQGGSG